MHLTTSYGRLLFLLQTHNFKLQTIIAFFNTCKDIISLFFLTDKHTDKLNPFGLSKRIEFLVA